MKIIEEKQNMDNAKRRALIEAAIQVVAHHGFHGAPIGFIAGVAKVAVGTVYLHFEDKDHLMLDAYRALEQRCLTAVMKNYPPRGDIRQRFSSLALGVIRYFKLFPEEFLFADQFLSSPYRKRVSPHFLPDGEVGRILQFFSQGAEEGIFKAMPPTMLLALACGPLIQVVRAHAVGYLYLDEERIARTVDSCWEAIARERGPACEGIVTAEGDVAQPPAFA
ncbi:TetR/AcrR family transcriptional regulator [Geomonas azotofigens]|uniref:TetR/AcrR family transcriptional regulator n=1 Tax=Geomonas azotofigens TaxID=2843196 RepID=UPI001C10E50C|nr:TetR/AcrR family transcriptional regulator [Geomonas azotofigens]MBU5613885.1 TetR/AcrR family transcriptional regulator [Geomonas azotofigens]